jgi:endonuclease/exonuclease/phosphatase family metal-dependent hydrolase
MNRINRNPFLLFCSFCLVLVVARAESLTIATYNLENYGPADRVTVDGYRKDYPKPEAEKRALRAVIRGLNADVLALQEMGDTPYLDELRRDLKAEGIEYPFAALAVTDDTNRRSALLSRRPLRNIATHPDLEFAYFAGKERVKRGLLEATIATAAGDVTIFVVHLKSRFTDRPDDPLSTLRRAGEATAIRDCILTRFPEPAAAGRFIIVGDCNDGRASRAVAHLQKRGSAAVAELLPAADSHGETWTHIFRREETYTRVDHIFISPALRVAAGGAARIYDADGVREASDHRPVLVVLQLNR